MLESAQSGDDLNMRKNAEALVNMIVGKQNTEQYKDWDGDGTLIDFSDGYGLLLNGDSSGYIHAVYSHAEYAATTPDTSDNIRMHGVHVMIASQNMEEWAPQLRDLAMSILQSATPADALDKINQAAQLADQLLNGLDLNGNEVIEPIKGEGGAITAHDHATYMANMDIYPGANIMPPAAPLLQDQSLPPNYGP